MFWLHKKVPQQVIEYEVYDIRFVTARFAMGQYLERCYVRTYTGTEIEITRQYIRIPILPHHFLSVP
jgi:hypothetical protein